MKPFFIKPIAWIPIVAMLLAPICVMDAHAQRGITVKLRASEKQGAPVSKEVQLYNASYALVIGIDNYTAGFPILSGAIKDAKIVADELRSRGFDVTYKTDLDSRELKQAFDHFFIYKGENPNARLFVWFAGHGHTIGGEGFLVPADAPIPEKKAAFKIKSLSMRRFGEYVRQAESKHVFAVFDSCFSGTIFTTQRSTPPSAITRATTLPVRQFLSSGDADQQVSDDGMFRKLFIRAINGEEKADANDDGYLTASELGMFLTDRMINLTKTAQSPRYGKLRDPDYDRGDFVFLVQSGKKYLQPKAISLNQLAQTGTEENIKPKGQILFGTWDVFTEGESKSNVTQNKNRSVTWTYSVPKITDTTYAGLATYIDPISMTNRNVRFQLDSKKGLPIQILFFAYIPGFSKGDDDDTFVPVSTTVYLKPGLQEIVLIPSSLKIPDWWREEKNALSVRFSTEDIRKIEFEAIVDEDVGPVEDTITIHTIMMQ